MQVQPSLCCKIFVALVTGKRSEKIALFTIIEWHITFEKMMIYLSPVCVLMCEDSNDLETNARSHCSHLCGLMMFFLVIFPDMTWGSVISSTFIVSFELRAADSAAWVAMCFLRLLECMKPKWGTFNIKYSYNQNC